MLSVSRGGRKCLACSSVRIPDLRSLEQAEIIVLGSIILNNSWIRDRDLWIVCITRFSLSYCIHTRNVN